VSIEVVPCDPRWPLQFSGSREELEAALRGDRNVVDKSSFLQRILAAAGFEPAELRAIEAANPPR
jgi:hypothetical protein